MGAGMQANLANYIRNHRQVTAKEADYIYRTHR